MKKYFFIVQWISLSIGLAMFIGCIFQSSNSEDYNTTKTDTDIRINENLIALGKTAVAVDSIIYCNELILKIKEAVLLSKERAILQNEYNLECSVKKIPEERANLKLTVLRQRVAEHPLEKTPTKELPAEKIPADEPSLEKNSVEDRPVEKTPNEKVPTEKLPPVQTPAVENPTETSKPAKLPPGETPDTKPHHMSKTCKETLKNFKGVKWGSDEFLALLDLTVVECNIKLKAKELLNFCDTKASFKKHPKHKKKHKKLKKIFKKICGKTHKHKKK